MRILKKPFDLGAYLSGAVLSSGDENAAEVVEDIIEPESVAELEPEIEFEKPDVAEDAVIAITKNSMHGSPAIDDEEPVRPPLFNNDGTKLPAAPEIILTPWQKIKVRLHISDLARENDKSIAREKSKIKTETIVDPESAADGSRRAFEMIDAAKEKMKAQAEAKSQRRSIFGFFKRDLEAPRGESRFTKFLIAFGEACTGVRNPYTSVPRSDSTGLVLLDLPPVILEPVEPPVGSTLVFSTADQHPFIGDVEVELPKRSPESVVTESPIEEIVATCNVWANGFKPNDTEIADTIATDSGPTFTTPPNADQVRAALAENSSRPLFPVINDSDLKKAEIVVNDGISPAPGISEPPTKDDITAAIEGGTSIFPVNR